MPYLEVHTSLVLSDEKKHELCEEIGKCVKLVPGKYKEITMMRIMDGCYIEHGAPEEQKDPCFNLTFRIGGISVFNAKRDFVREVTKMVAEKYGVKPGHLFINIFECDQWGTAGNFKQYNVIDPSLYD